MGKAPIKQQKRRQTLQKKISFKDIFQTFVCWGKKKMSASENLKFIFFKKLELRHAIPLNFRLIYNKLIMDVTLLHGKF